MKQEGREVILQQVDCDKVRLCHRFAIDDKECSQFCGWTGSWLKKVFISITILSLLSPLLCYGVDLSSGIRNMQKHEAWMSFEVRNGLTGMFLASRASIMDETTGTTLNFTFLPKNRCRSIAVLLFQLDFPSSKKIKEEAIVGVTVDKESRQLIPAAFMVEAGDKFAFYDISENFKGAELSGHNSAVFSVEDVGTTTFSLSGFAKARKEAQLNCEAFMPSHVIRE